MIISDLRDDVVRSQVKWPADQRSVLQDEQRFYLMQYRIVKKPSVRHPAGNEHNEPGDTEYLETPQMKMKPISSIRADPSSFPCFCFLNEFTANVIGGATSPIIGIPFSPWATWQLN